MTEHNQTWPSFGEYLARRAPGLMRHWPRADKAPIEALQGPYFARKAIRDLNAPKIAAAVAAATPMVGVVSALAKYVLPKLADGSAQAAARAAAKGAVTVNLQTQRRDLTRHVQQMQGRKDATLLLTAGLRPEIVKVARELSKEWAPFGSTPQEVCAALYEIAMQLQTADFSKRVAAIPEYEMQYAEPMPDPTSFEMLYDVASYKELWTCNHHMMRVPYIVASGHPLDDNFLLVWAILRASTVELLYLVAAAMMQSSTGKRVDLKDAHRAQGVEIVESFMGAIPYRASNYAFDSSGAPVWMAAGAPWEVIEDSMITGFELWFEAATGATYSLDIPQAKGYMEGETKEAYAVRMALPPVRETKVWLPPDFAAMALEAFELGMLPAYKQAHASTAATMEGLMQRFSGRRPPSGRKGPDHKDIATATSLTTYASSVRMAHSTGYPRHLGRQHISYARGWARAKVFLDENTTGYERERKLLAKLNDKCPDWYDSVIAAYGE
jgi:hypothetical protein